MCASAKYYTHQGGQSWASALSPVSLRCLDWRTLLPSYAYGLLTPSPALQNGKGHGSGDRLVRLGISWVSLVCKQLTTNLSKKGKLSTQSVAPQTASGKLSARLDLGAHSEFLPPFFLLPCVLL